MPEIVCPFKLIFHIPCPGCGMGRACLAFLHGDILGALYWHPLFWLLPLWALLFVLSRITDSAGDYRFKVCKSITTSRITYIVAFLAIMLCYAVRMVLMYPGVQPMDIAL